MTKGKGHNKMKKTADASQILQNFNISLVDSRNNQMLKVKNMQYNNYTK